MTDNRPRKGRRRVIRARPIPDGTAVARMRGLDLMSAMKEGRLPPPPVWGLVDLRLLEFGEGRAVMEMTPAERHYNRFGVVQGGILCPVLDAAAGYAVHSTLPVGTGYTTLDLKVNYLRPVSAETGPLRCEGRIVHRGSRVCLAEADLTDGKGRLYAHALSTCLLIKLSKKRAA